MEKVLIDSSVMIELFRDKGHACLEPLRALAGEGRAHLAAPVIGEVLQGTKPEDRASVRSAMQALPYLILEDSDVLQAGEVAAAMRDKGLQPGLIDALIACLALKHQASLFTLDKQFGHFPKLKLYQP